MELSDHIEQTITDLERMARDYEGKAVALRLAAHNIRTRFESQGLDQKQGAVAVPLPDTIDNCAELGSDAGEAEPKHLAAGPRGKHPASGYQGVIKGKQRNDGTTVYKAMLRGKYIGCSVIAEIAAARVQRALGNVREADRLDKIGRQKLADRQEQAENNPDREPRTRAPAKPDGKHAAGVWECPKCCHQHIVAKRPPEKCEQCGSEALKKIA